jgi:hypothetical protein
MTTETAPVAEQVAPTAQEPSTVQEVNTNEAPNGEQGKAELSEPEKIIEAQNKKIARQQAANREQQRQFEEARKKLAEYEAKLAAKPDPLADKPNPDNFDDQDTYADALADWKIAQREKAKAEEPKQPDVEKLADQKAQWKLKEIEFNGKQESYRKENPNYDNNAQVVNQFLGLANKSDPRFAAFSTVLMNAENPPALINYLGENPREIMALFNAETPLEVEFALEGIVEKLGAPINAGEDDEPVQTPKALPTPPSALKAGQTKVNKSPDQMTGRELLNKYAKGKIT